MQRIKNRAQFQAVLAGQTVARSSHFVLHRLLLQAGQAKPSLLDLGLSGTSPEKNSRLTPLPTRTHQFTVPLFDVSGNWLGAMVPKRWAKRAVTRNMIKRRIYSLAEAASIEATPLKAHAAYVVRLRSAFDAQTFKSATSPPLREAVHQELRGLFALGFQRG